MAASAKEPHDGRLTTLPERTRVLVRVFDGVQPPFVRNALEHCCPAFAEPKARAGYQILDRARDEHLAWLGPLRDSRSNVHGDPSDLAVDDLALTGVQTCADLEPELAHALRDRPGASDRTGRAVEPREGTIAGDVELAPRKRTSSRRISAWWRSSSSRQSRSPSCAAFAVEPTMSVEEHVSARVVVCATRTSDPIVQRSLRHVGARQRAGPAVSGGEGQATGPAGSSTPQSSWATVATETTLLLSPHRVNEHEQHHTYPTPRTHGKPNHSCDGPQPSESAHGRASCRSHSDLRKAYSTSPSSSPSILSGHGW